MTIQEMKKRFEFFDVLSKAVEKQTKLAENGLDYMIVELYQDWSFHLNCYLIMDRMAYDMIKNHVFDKRFRMYEYIQI